MADINLKKYAGQGQAVALFGTFLPDNIESYANVHVLSADMSAAASLSRYIHQNPDKFTEIGIAEQNLVGISSGMASEGFTPIAIAQAAFITMRAFEMNRQYLGYMKNKVILMGRLIPDHGRQLLGIGFRPFRVRIRLIIRLLSRNQQGADHRRQQQDQQQKSARPRRIARQTQDFSQKLPHAAPGYSGFPVSAISSF